MQVSAHKIVSLFGIDALGALHSYENQPEIDQCREDWKIAHSSLVVIKSFNDGNSEYEVQANLDSLTAEYIGGGDATNYFKEKIFEKYIERDDKRKMFGIGGLDFELIGKLING